MTDARAERIRGATWEVWVDTPNKLAHLTVANFAVCGRPSRHTLLTTVGAHRRPASADDQRCGICRRIWEASQ